MCGIVGYIGTKKACPILLAGLSRLEYRGYDSAGISTIEKSGLSLMKDKGRVKNLYNLEGIDELEGTVGIAHTRWATHGKPSKENAHPHQDNSKTFSVVHNGIIENFNELRNFLLENGYTFYSQTDTEIIPNLIHYYFYKDTENDDLKFLRAVRNACLDLKGSFALEVISKLYPDNMVVVRKDSPLVIGTCEDEKYLSSDIPAILSYTRDFYLLNDLEFVLLTKSSARFFDTDLKEVEKETKTIEWNASAAEKDGFDDFMLKEIYEQPSAIRETIGAKLNLDSTCEFDELKFTKEYLSSLNKIYIVACGTAMHAGLSGKNAIEKLCRIPVEVDIASEFRYRDPILQKGDMVIVISQSGETADTLAALRETQKKGFKVLGIVNVVGSSIAREANSVMYTWAGPEIAVATTKAYSAQLTALYILALKFARVKVIMKQNQYESMLTCLQHLPDQIELLLEQKEKIQYLANRYAGSKDIFFIGRGIDYAISLEGSLKLKEISYIHSEAYPAGELKHGTISLIEEGSLIIALATQPKLYQKTISNMTEVRSRGAKVMAITFESNKLMEKAADYVIYIPETDPYFANSLAIIPLQLLAYYIAIGKGCDVDKPRNLAKSVTVE